MSEHFWKLKARAHPRAVLAGALAFIALGAGAYFLSPWLLPVRILEGPLVQRAGEDAVTLVWYVSRPAVCEITLKIDGKEQTQTAQADGKRLRARFTGLSPNKAYAYSIRVGQRVLASAALRTNKPADQPFSFLVFGDSGKASREQYQLAARMPDFAPDFILHTGDLVYGGGERERYDDRFFGPYRDLLARVSFWPCLGNHDVAEEGHSGAAYREVFELPENGPAGRPPEHHYWFDYAGARIAVIDSNETEALLKDAVAPWLLETMAGANGRWKFVALHHPPYSVGQHGPNDVMQRALVPAFEAAGVQIVFCGHDHLYERTHPMRGGQIAAAPPGVVYIVSGAGGAGLYDTAPREQWPPYMAAVQNQTHSFTHVQINGDQLTLRQIALNGAVLDQTTLQKTPAGGP